MASEAKTKRDAAGVAHVEPRRRAKHGVACRQPDRHPDRVIADLAETQHGIVARFQLLAAGLGRRAIGGRLERGTLHPVHRGVYATGHASVSVLGKWMAATLALGPDAVLSHRSAGQLWGVVPTGSQAVDVTRATTAWPRTGISGHCLRLPDDERTAVEGIPVTTVPRTLLDLAAVASRRQVERALNEVEVQALTDPLSIPDLLARYPGRRGTAILRKLLLDDAHTGGVTKNDMEEKFASIIDRRGLPRPRFNADISVSGRFFSADCLWGRERLIVELDGRATHGTRRAFESDRERDRLLLAAGWIVMRVTWHQLCNQAAAVAADVSRVLSERRPC